MAKTHETPRPDTSARFVSPMRTGKPRNKPDIIMAEAPPMPSKKPDEEMTDGPHLLEDEDEDMGVISSTSVP